MNQEGINLEFNAQIKVWLTIELYTSGMWLTLRLILKLSEDSLMFHAGIFCEWLSAYGLFPSVEILILNHNHRNKRE